MPQLGIRVPSETLRRFWTMLAHYHGQSWNASELARSIGASPKTALYYRDILAGGYMVRVLPPWFENLKKRQVKSPKIYIRDTGLLHMLLGITDMASLRSHPRYGASWEGFALEQVLALLGSRGAYFWSTQRGAGLDLLLFRGGKRWGFEFKCSDAPSMTKSMHIALQDLSLNGLFVVYPGRERYRLDKRVEALPLMHCMELQKTEISQHSEPIPRPRNLNLVTVTWVFIHFPGSISCFGTSIPHGNLSHVKGRPHFHITAIPHAPKMVTKQGLKFFCRKFR